MTEHCFHTGNTPSAKVDLWRTSYLSPLLKIVSISHIYQSIMSLSSIIVRTATVADLPFIGGLIKESFVALSDHYGASTRSVWEKGAQDVIEDDLSVEKFEKVYFSIPGNHFWVAQLESEVVGCVAIKRKCSDESELVRMAVASSRRGHGIGGKIIEVLLAHCKERKVSRVLLGTANPQAAHFYEKAGFRYIKKFEHLLQIPGVPEVTMNIASMVYYLGAKVVRRVGLVGGTHGNELLGVELVRRWLLNQNTPGAADELKRTTLECVPVLSNLPAINANRRYIDKDLNRQFKRETLDTILKNTADDADPSKAVEMEDYSATRLNALLGPKTEFYTTPTKVDFTVDMHSSTSNLGNMLILGCLTHDNLAAHVAQSVKQALSPGGKPIAALSNGIIRVASTDVTKEVSHWVDSLSPSGLAIEVGPLAHGTMNAGLLEDTRQIVLAIVNFLEDRNIALLNEAQKTLDGLRPEARAQYANFDVRTATFVPVELAPKSAIPEGVVGDGTTLSNLDYYFMVNPLLFPTTETSLTTVPQLSSQLADLSATEGLSAATAAKLGSALEKLVHAPVRETIVHTSLDCKDWVPLSEDAPLFQTTTGSGEVTAFHRAVHAPTVTDANAKLYPVFINEAAYQGSNMAMWIVKDAQFTLY